MKITAARAMFLLVFLATGVIFGFAIWSGTNTWVQAQKIGMTGLDVFITGLLCGLALVE